MTEREDLDRAAERLAERLAAPTVGSWAAGGDPDGPVVVSDVTAGGPVTAEPPPPPAAPALHRTPHTATVDSPPAEPDRVVHDAAVVSVAGQRVTVSDSAIV